MKKLLLIGLMVCVLGACATSHPVRSLNDDVVQVREAGGFLQQPVTVGGYLVLAGISLALQIAVLLSAQR